MGQDFFLLTCLLSESVMFGPLEAQVWEQNIANSDNRFVISKKPSYHYNDIIQQTQHKVQPICQKSKRSTLFMP